MRRLLWIVHNCIAHPCLGFFPTARWATLFHDFTAPKHNMPLPHQETMRIGNSIAITVRSSNGRNEFRIDQPGQNDVWMELTDADNSRLANMLSRWKRSAW